MARHREPVYLFHDAAAVEGRCQGALSGKEYIQCPLNVSAVVFVLRSNARVAGYVTYGVIDRTVHFAACGHLDPLDLVESANSVVFGLQLFASHNSEA